MAEKPREREGVLRLVMALQAQYHSDPEFRELLTHPDNGELRTETFNVFLDDWFNGLRADEKAKVLPVKEEVRTVVNEFLEKLDPEEMQALRGVLGLADEVRMLVT